MRRVVVLALLAMTLPMAAWASSISLSNQYGTIAVSNAGIVSKGSELMSFNGISAPAGHDLGTVNFKTGALLSGSLTGSATFSAVGSSFIINSMGKYGQPHGAIFVGSFVGPITLTLVTQNPHSAVWTLTGQIQGMSMGHMVTGTTTQTIYSTTSQIAGGIGHIRVGSTSMTAPEPGTLGLLGTGLVGIAGVFRRKLLGA